MGIDGYKKRPSWQLYMPTHYTGYLSYTSQKRKSEGLSQREVKNIKEMNEIINIPISAFNLQIIKSKKRWVLEYSISEDRSVQIVINKPCDIERIYKENDKWCVVLNTYSTHEYLNL